MRVPTARESAALRPVNHCLAQIEALLIEGHTTDDLNLNKRHPLQNISLIQTIVDSGRSTNASPLIEMIHLFRTATI
jgi:hypothetical protein